MSIDQYILLSTLWLCLTFTIWYSYHILIKYYDSFNGSEPYFLVCFFCLPIVILCFIIELIILSINKLNINYSHIEGIENKIKKYLDDIFHI